LSGVIIRGTQIIPPKKHTQEKLRHNPKGKQPRHLLTRGLSQMVSHLRQISASPEVTTASSVSPELIPGITLAFNAHTYPTQWHRSIVTNKAAVMSRRNNMITPPRYYTRKRPAIP
jgi:hypothetical protein